MKRISCNAHLNEFFAVSLASLIIDVPIGELYESIRMRSGVTTQKLVGTAVEPAKQHIYMIAKWVKQNENKQSKQAHRHGWIGSEKLSQKAFCDVQAWKLCKQTDYEEEDLECKIKSDCRIHRRISFFYYQTLQVLLGEEFRSVQCLDNHALWVRHLSPVGIGENAWLRWRHNEVSIQCETTAICERHDTGRWLVNLWRLEWSTQIDVVVVFVLIRKMDDAIVSPCIRLPFKHDRANITNNLSSSNFPLGESRMTGMICT